MTILNLIVFLYFWISGGPELREGATSEQNFFSDICSDRYSSIENLMHYMKFQKNVLVNRSSAKSYLFYAWSETPYQGSMERQPQPRFRLINYYLAKS